MPEKPTVEALENRVRELEEALLERDRVIEELQHSAEMYRKLVLDTMEEMVAYHDLDLRVQWTNGAAARSVGETVDDLVGRYCYEIWQGRDTPCVDCPVLKAIQIGRPQEIETATPDGRYYRIRGYPVHDEHGAVIGAVEYGFDITDRKKAELELRESEEKYRKLVTTAPYGIQLTDREGKILFSNPAHHRIQGYDEGELIGKTIWELMANDKHRSIARAYYQKLIEEQPPPEVYFNRDLTRDGREIDVQVNWDYIRNTNGDVEGIISIISDITKQKVLESSIRQAQKMESIGTLAGGVAHDFNNILTSIIGFSEIGLDVAEKDSILEKSLKEIFAAGDRAKELVKQILVFARRSEEEIKPVQPGLIIREAAKFLRSSIPTTIDIRLNIDSDSFIMANSTQIHQVIMNICTNASHAMEDDGGLLEISLKDVTASHAGKLHGIDLKPGNYIELAISDTGTGIPPEIIESIFDPYYTTKAHGEGIGLGLAVVHGIVETYGGRIIVESVLGKGTTFTTYLPIKKHTAIRPEYSTEPVPSGSERILFVDDEPPITRMGKQLLERLGYKVTVKNSSMAALDLFRAKPADFDLVVTDMTMPEMTGDKLALALMRIRPDIPVILCSGYSKKMSNEAAMDIGIKAFITKPIVKADLAKIVRKVLDKKNLMH